MRKEELPIIVQKAVADAMKGIALGLHTSSTHEGVKGGGKGGGKSAKRAEERTRTVSFTNFPANTKEAIIKTFIAEKLSTFRQEDIDEVYTFDKRDTKGMARFRTMDAMWAFMAENVGKHKHEFEGNRIYVDVVDKNQKDWKREKAVRKIVRLIIEHNGGNGEQVKKELDISYRKGHVWKGDTQLAEWDKEEEKMKLMNEAMNYSSEFSALMKE